VHAFSPSFFCVKKERKKEEKITHKPNFRHGIKQRNKIAKDEKKVTRKRMDNLS
jgi:hypothetical protein